MTHLLPKLRCHYAEFLNEGSLKRLGIFFPPTCVGLRYDHPFHSLEAFLGSVGSASLLPIARHPHHFSVLTICRIFLANPPTSLDPVFQHGNGLPSYVPPSLKRERSGTGIL